MMLTVAIALCSGAADARDPLVLAVTVEGSRADARAVADVAAARLAALHLGATVNAHKRRVDVYSQEPRAAVEPLVVPNGAFSVHEVDPTVTLAQLSEMLTDAKQALSADAWADDARVEAWLRAQHRIAESSVLGWEREQDVRRQPVLYRAEPILDASGISRATVASSGGVSVELDSEGSNALCTATTAHVGAHLAIVFDGTVESAPKLLTPLCTDKVRIDLPDPAAAAVLAAVLSTGPYPVAVRLKTAPIP